MNDREIVANRLAQRHYQFEPDITEIRTIYAPDPCESFPNVPIKLLEVNANTVPSGILPLRFDAVPASGITYPSVIVEVTPEEYERIKRNELPLPHGWLLGPLLQRPSGKDNAA